MKTEHTVVDLKTTIASDHKKIELNLGTKCCSKCLEPKPLESFDKNKTKKDGYDSRCKACISKVKATKYRKKKQLKSKRRDTNTLNIADFEVIDVYVVDERRDESIFRELIGAISCNQK
jgi:hypothetical protein